MRKVFKAICAGAAAVLFVLGANVQPQVDGNEMVVTKDQWTAHKLGGIAIDKKMAVVVSDIVGIALESAEFETPMASVRERFWERIDLATTEDIRASILKHTAGRKKGNSISSNRTNSLISSNNTVTTTTATTNSGSSSSSSGTSSNTTANINSSSWNISSRSKLERFAKTENAAATCSTPGSAGGQGLAVCIGQCENKRSLLLRKSPREGACHLLCALAVAPCEKHTSWSMMNGTETINAMVAFAVPSRYSDTARDMLKIFYQLCLDVSAGATTAAQVSLYHAEVALDATMDWLRTTFYPWACAAAQDIADCLRTVYYPWACAVAENIAHIVSVIAVSLWEAVYRLLSLALLGVRTSAQATMNWLSTALYPWTCAAAVDMANIVSTNAVSLWETAYRSTSAGLSTALKFVVDLSGSAVTGAMKFATATAASLRKLATEVLGAAADVFWTCPAGNTVEDAMMLMLGEVATAFLDAAGGFWSCPAGEVVAKVTPMLVEVATGIFDAVRGLWACSAMEATRATVVLGEAATAFLDAVGGFWACPAGKMVTNVMMPMLGECAAAVDMANIVSTNAVSLWETAYRSTSAGLSTALKFVVDLSGSAVTGAMKFATATAASLRKLATEVLGAATDVFWTCPAGSTVEDAMMLMLGEVATAFLDAAGGFWSCPAGEVVAKVTPMLVEVATGIFDAVRGLWACSAMEATRATVVLGEAATAFLDAVGGFWACPAGKMVTNVMMPMLGEVATGIFDAVRGLWACPAMEPARATVVTLVENAAATVVEVVLHLCFAAVEGGKSLVKTHLLEDKPSLAVLLLVIVHAACQYCKLRTARACTHELGGDVIIGEVEELPKQVESTQGQASDLKLSYADRFHRRRGQRKGLRCLEDRVSEATARRYLDARRDDRMPARPLSHANGNAVAVRFARWKGVGGAGRGSGTRGGGGAASDTGNAATQRNGRSRAGDGVVAPSSGNPAQGSGGAGAGNGIPAQGDGGVEMCKGNAEPRRPNPGSWWAMLDDDTPVQGSGNPAQGSGNAEEGTGNGEPPQPGSLWAMLG